MVYVVEPWFCLQMIVVLVVTSWYGGCIGLVNDCCTVVVFVAHVVVVVALANVEMVLPNLSWTQRGYGNIAVTVASCGCGSMCCEVVVDMIAVMVVNMIAVVVVE